MRRWTALVLVVAAIFAACGSQPEAGQAKKLKVSTVPLMTYVPLYMAVEKGYFAAQGLDVELVEFKRSSEALPALARERIDVAGASISAALLNAIGRTKAIKVVAGKGQLGDGKSGCSEAAFLAPPAKVDAGQYRTAADLKGRKVSGNAIGIDGWRFDVMMRRVGLSIDALDVVDIDEALLIKALNSGAVDVAQAPEPWITRIADSGAGRVWLTVEESTPNIQQGVLLFGPSLMRDDPEAGERFMRAYVQALREYDKGKTESNARILGKATKLERRLVDKACWPRFDAQGGIHWQSIDSMQRWFHGRKLVDRVLTKDEVWTSRFVDHANDELGRG